jgi:CubicO group peptidase (beta-lactamase class C family)
MRKSLYIIVFIFFLGLWGCDETPTEPTKPTLAALMADKLEDTLRGRDVGYAFSIFEGEQLIVEKSGGFKSKTNDPEGQKSFLPTTKMHVASMTKTLTAMAFLKVAAQKNLRTTDRIAPYLPPSWAKGSNIDLITFGDLLTHRSGIVGLGSNCANGSFSENIYGGLKRLVAKGIGNKGNYCYQNANFGLFRVLIPSILGYKFTGNDATDDSETQKRFLAFLQTEIFEKVGIKDAITTYPTGDPTYTYSLPATSTQRGWNPGEFSQTLGGYGMYLTAREATQIYASALSGSSDKILVAAQADSILIKNLGCYKATATLGTFYYHDGWWYSSLSTMGQGLRTIWMKLPNNLTCVLFVNTLRWRTPANSLDFPFNNGNIVGFVYNAYAQANQARNARVGAVPTLAIEHPEPH